MAVKCIFFILQVIDAYLHTLIEKQQVSGSHIYVHKYTRHFSDSMGRLLTLASVCDVVLLLMECSALLCPTA